MEESGVPGENHRLTPSHRQCFDGREFEHVFLLDRPRKYRRINLHDKNDLWIGYGAKIPIEEVSFPMAILNGHLELVKIAIYGTLHYFRCLTVCDVRDLDSI